MTVRRVLPRIRFEVFKRDGFRCAYCGRTPPAVVLHVDHVLAVSAGGTDDESNLVTACSDCNLGKSNISLDVVPKPLLASAEELREREEQLREYQALLLAKRERLEEESWRIAEALDDSVEREGSYSRGGLLSISRFLERLGFDSVLDAAEIARAKMRYPSPHQAFRYFCGVCWKRIRELEANKSLHPPDS